MLNFATNLMTTLSDMIDNARTPVTQIPGLILSLSAVKRPGLSPTVIAANIIRRQSEAGAPVGPMPDGSSNISESMEVIRVEEIVKAIQMDGCVQVGIPIGAIQIKGVGANAGGPVDITGFNINAPSGTGILM